MNTSFMRTVRISKLNLDKLKLPEGWTPNPEIVSSIRATNVIVGPPIVVRRRPDGYESRPNLGWENYQIIAGGEKILSYVEAFKGDKNSNSICVVVIESEETLRALIPQIKAESHGPIIGEAPEYFSDMQPEIKPEPKVTPTPENTPDKVLVAEKPISANVDKVLVDETPMSANVDKVLVDEKPMSANVDDAKTLAKKLNPGVDLISTPNGFIPVAKSTSTPKTKATKAKKGKSGKSSTPILSAKDELNGICKKAGYETAIWIKSKAEASTKHVTCPLNGGLKRGWYCIRKNGTGFYLAASVEKSLVIVKEQDFGLETL